jgi:hypothetical protein
MSEQAQAAELPAIYVFCNQKNCDGSGDWHSMIAVAEDGTALAGHICSSHSWAMHDMGVNEDGWKRELYAAHYPNGFRVIWLGTQSEKEELIARLPKPAREARVLVDDLSR